jgi:hypothetical protein
LEKFIPSVHLSTTFRVQTAYPFAAPYSGKNYFFAKIDLAFHVFPDVCNHGQNDDKRGPTSIFLGKKIDVGPRLSD